MLWKNGIEYTQIDGKLTSRTMVKISPSEIPSCVSAQTDSILTVSDKKPSPNIWYSNSLAPLAGIIANSSI